MKTNIDLHKSLSRFSSPVFGEIYKVCFPALCPLARESLRNIPGRPIQLCSPVGDRKSKWWFDTKTLSPSIVVEGPQFFDVFWRCPPQVSTGTLGTVSLLVPTLTIVRRFRYTSGRDGLLVTEDEDGEYTHVERPS